MDKWKEAGETGTYAWLVVWVREDWCEVAVKRKRNDEYGLARDAEI